MADLDEQVRNGEEAQYLLSHLLYKSAFDELEQELFEQLADVNMHDRASQTELLRTVKNLRRLKGVLERHIVNGEAAKQLLKRSARDRILNAVGY